MFDIPWIEVYVPLALAFHAFVAWHVWHARREANDAMDYVQGSGEYERDGGLAADVMVLVNEQLAGGAVGAVGEMVAPAAKLVGQRIEAWMKERAQANPPAISKASNGSSDIVVTNGASPQDAKPARESAPDR